MVAPYTELAGKKISRGYNVNASTAIPAKRFCGYSAATSATDDAVDLLSVTGLTKIKGVTQKEIAVGAVGDIYADDDIVVPVESTAAAVAVGDELVCEQSTGKVLACPATAATAFNVVGIACSAVSGSGGDVQVRLKRYVRTNPA